MAYPVPETLIRTSHSLTIRTTGPNSKTVGLINGWSPTMGRTITPAYQIATNHLNVKVRSPPH